MSVGFTIPMARALLAEGRTAEVARMLEPLLEPALNGSAASPSDEASLRALLARIRLLDENDVEGARTLLQPVASRETLVEAGTAARADVELWLGWCDLLSGDAARRGGAAVRLAVATLLSGRSAIPETALWCHIGRAMLAADRGLTTLAAHYTETARRMQTAIASSQADRWLTSLPGQGFARRSPLPAHVCASREMIDLTAEACLAAENGVSLVITGERGTGRRHLARAIQRQAGRPDESFRVLRGGGDAVYLLETSLRDALASGVSTLCLHDVEEIPTAVQRRAASGAAEHGARLMLTSTRDFVGLVDSGRIDPALLQACGLVQLSVPPLRKRPDDVELLVRHFLRTLRKAPGLPAAVTDDAMALLRHYPWPGNVRQLRNEIERALLHVQSEPAPVIRSSVLSPDVRGAGNGEGNAGNEAGDLERIVAQTERAVIESALARTGGQVATSAELLGVSRQGLYKKMKRLGIDPAKYQVGQERLEVNADV